MGKRIELVPGGLAVIAIVAAILTGYALWQGHEADHEAEAKAAAAAAVTHQEAHKAQDGALGALEGKHRSVSARPSSRGFDEVQERQDRRTTSDRQGKHEGSR